MLLGHFQPGTGGPEGQQGLDGVAPIGNLVAVIVDLPSSALWAVPLTVPVTEHRSAGNGKPRVSDSRQNPRWR